HGSGISGPLALWDYFFRQLLGLHRREAEPPGQSVPALHRYLGNPVRSGAETVPAGADPAGSCYAVSGYRLGMAAIYSRLRPEHRGAAALPHRRASLPASPAPSAPGLQPVQHVPVDILFPALVKDLVAQTVVELHGHVTKPSLLKA